MFPLHDPIPQGADHPPYPLDKSIYHSLLDEHWDLVYFSPVSDDMKRSGGTKGDEAVGVWALKV